MGLGNRITHILIIFFMTITMQKLLQAYDNAHFYRALFFSGEPRLEKKHLSTFDTLVCGGSSFSGLDKCGNKTFVLDIYGAHNMQFLGKNLPKNDNGNRESDNILNQLLQIPLRDTFGQISFFGEFSTWEIVFSYIKNFKKGFFGQIHIPVRKLEIFPVSYYDLSPDDQIEPNSRNLVWREFLEKFHYILRDFDLCIDNFCASSIGDTSLVVGWTKNYENTSYLDFIDGTIKGGISLPTGKQKNEDRAFSMPLGYNGHIGLNISGNLALGLYEWVTMGIYTDVTFFNKKTKSRRIKTAIRQSGLIKLAKANTTIKKGNLYNAGFFLKADHFFLGLSFIFGYTFCQKQNDHLTFCQTDCFDRSIANNDETLRKWRMHTIHFLLEYDFTREEHRFGPRISAFYNHVAGGKRIIKTDTGGVGFGLEIAWNL